MTERLSTTDTDFLYSESPGAAGRTVGGGRGSPVGSGNYRPLAAAVSEQVVCYLLDLAIAEADPVVRLRQVAHAMAAHTDSVRQVGARALSELGRFAPPTLHAMQARVGGQLSGRTYDLLIANVPGPGEQLSAAGYPAPS